MKPENTPIVIRANVPIRESAYAKREPGPVLTAIRMLEVGQSFELPDDDRQTGLKATAQVGGESKKSGKKFACRRYKTEDGFKFAVWRTA